MTNLQKVAQVDGPGRMSESFFPANFGRIFDQLFPGGVVDLAEGHEDARQAAVPVGLLLVVVDGPAETNWNCACYHFQRLPAKNRART